MEGRIAWVILVAAPLPLALWAWFMPRVVGVLLVILSRFLFCAGLSNPCDILGLIGLVLLAFSPGHLILL